MIKDVGDKSEKFIESMAFYDLMTLLLVKNMPMTWRSRLATARLPSSDLQGIFLDDKGNPHPLVLPGCESSIHLSGDNTPRKVADHLQLIEIKYLPKRSCQIRNENYYKKRELHDENNMPLVYEPSRK